MSARSSRRHAAVHLYHPGLGQAHRQRSTRRPALLWVYLLLYRDLSLMGLTRGVRIEKGSFDPQKGDRD